ncbi:MAG: metal ABC transporter permease [Actinomycetota bacterium]|nr:metal ABC transporter permease [Actinomycetota bacterium]
MSGLWHALADPWGQAIMQRALIEVVLLSVSGAALGCWIVFYEASYSAESLPHAMFPGLVVAALTGLPLVLGGAVGLLVAALAVALAARIPGIGRDTGVAVVVTALFALGVLLALAPASPAGVQSLLFGDILAITAGDLWLAGGLAVGVLLALRLLHTRLLTVGFDRSSAASLGARPLRADAAVLILLAVAVLVAVQALGNLLVVAVLIAPAAAARLVCRRMAPMMATAAGLAVLGCVVGLYASFHLHTAAGASIAVTTVLAYLTVAAVRRRPAVARGARAG